MKKKNLVIYDRSNGYGQRLAAYISEQEELDFQVHFCSTKEHVNSCWEAERIDVLILGEAEKGEWEEQLPGIHFYLTEEEVGAGHLLYKYQSVALLLQKFLEICMEEGISFRLRTSGKKQLIGIYSPVHRIGKTSFALTLGQLLGQNDSVLYLNLEEYAGMGGHFPETTSGNLSDFFYYVRQQEESLGLRLKMLVRQIGGLDYLVPIPINQDLREIPCEDWMTLFDQLLTKSIYRTILVDSGECMQGLLQILERCDLIYMPVLEEEVAQAKVKQFERNLKVMGMEAMLEKIKKIRLTDNLWEDARQLVRKDRLEE